VKVEFVLYFWEQKDKSANSAYDASGEHSSRKERHTRCD